MRNLSRLPSFTVRAAAGKMGDSLADGYHLEVDAADDDRDAKEEMR